jgi:hypothetical protein
MIEQRDGKWCLLTKDGSRVLGCHDTREEAEAQERAIEARKNASQLQTLTGVEIFQAGKWNGDDYTIEDLDRMVEAAQQVGFTPPLKAGHADEGQPALGWVENLRRVGSKLLADLVGLPARVYEAIRERRYDRVSAEIYWNLERNGKKFPRALKALALLGAQIPAVDLKPLHELFSMPPWPSLPPVAFHAYAVDLALPGPPDDDGQPKRNLRAPARSAMTTKKHNQAADQTDDDADGDLKPDAGGVVVSLTQLDEFKAKAARLEQLEAEHEKAKEVEGRLAKLEDDRRRERIEAKVATLKVPAFRPFARAFYDLATHSDGAKRYALADPKKSLSPEEIVDAWLAETNRNAARLFQVLSVQPKAVDHDEPEEASARVDYRVKKYLAAHPQTDYKTALRVVLDADPELKQAYAAS